MAKYHVFTDGSSRGNPGVGGWATVVMNEDESKIIFSEHDTEDYTTNNRMELKAMLCAFHYAEDHPNDYFIIHSDSAYVVFSCTQWMRKWAANGWRNSKKQEVENIDLMKALYSHLSRDFPNFEVRKCSGHSGDIGNELADAIATSNWRKFKELVLTWEITLEETPEDFKIFETKEQIELIGDNWFPVD